MTQLGDELLIAYSDGELSTRQREEIGVVLEHDPITALRLKKLQNTRNRLALLFGDILADHSQLRVENIINLPKQEGEKDPAQKKVKQPLVRQSNKKELKKQAKVDETGVASSTIMPSDDMLDLGAITPAGQPVRSRKKNRKIALEKDPKVYVDHEALIEPAQIKGSKAGANRLVVNLLSTALILGVGLASGYFYQEYKAQNSAAVDLAPNLYAPVVNGGWTTAVINHHSLMRREVIEAARIKQKNIGLVTNQLNSALQMQVVVPDFSSHGLDFARAQILTHNNSKIAQITYLPTQGDPVSLYLRRSKHAVPVENGSLGAVNMVHWGQGANGFVLAGKLPHWQLIVMSVEVKRQFTQRMTQN